MILIGGGAGSRSCSGVCATVLPSRVGPANGEHQEEEDVDEVFSNAGKTDLVVDLRLHVQEVARHEAGQRGDGGGNKVGKCDR